MSSSWWSDLGAFLQFAPPPAPASAELGLPSPPPKPVSPEDAALREAKAALKDSLRELQREVGRMRREEARKLRRVRELAEEGRVDRARLEAKQLVGTRKAILRVERGCQRLNQIHEKLQVQRTSLVLFAFAQKAAAVLKAMNGAADPARVAALGRGLVEENEKFNMNMESVAEALDDMFDGDDTDSEALGDEFSEETVLEQILTDCGLAQASSLPSVPEEAPSAAESAAPAEARAQPVQEPAGAAASLEAARDDDLAARLARLQSRK